MVVDLHVHVGARGLPVEAVLKRAPELGLAGVALVDDDALPDLAPYRDKAGELQLFAGAEVTTDRGHYLVFLPQPENLPPLTELLGERVNGAWPVRDVLVRVRALGGACVAAHPYDRNVERPGGDILYTLTALTAVETVNGARRSDIALPAIEAAETLGLPCVGGSDARRSIDELGRGATLFTKRLENEAALCEALRSGACWPMDFGDLPDDFQRRSHAPRPAPAPRGEGGEARPRRRRRR